MSHQKHEKFTQHEKLKGKHLQGQTQDFWKGVSYT